MHVPSLLYSWRSVTYQVAVCLAPARVDAITAAWPGGVIDLLEMVTAPRFPIASTLRAHAAREILAAAGEPAPPSKGLPLPSSADADLKLLAEHMRARLLLPPAADEVRAAALARLPAVRIATP